LLVAAGHQNPLKYSPRQALAWLELAMRRQADEAKRHYLLNRSAFWADEKQEQQLLEQLDGE